MMPAGQDRFAKGERIDRYEIRELIGQGGMGAVYRAIDGKLGRTVAVKTVVAHRRGERLTEEVRQRFLREALAISKVEHRNVVQVLDFGFADSGTPFLVMEYLRGRDLGSLLKDDDRPLEIAYVADVLLGVCAALRACHHVGIIHRDLKPGNIFLADTDTGFEVKVLDFGVSKAPQAAELTLDGQILGTPQYLSPEQVTGTAGPESDQYALGALLYVCLTKRLPYQDLRDFQLLRAISLGKFAPPSEHRPGLPAELEAIVLRAMRVNPKERFESVHALGQKLWQFASPRGKEQWKNLYFHTPPMPRPAKQSTHGIAMVEAIAARPAGSATPGTAGLGPAGAGLKVEAVGAGLRGIPEVREPGGERDKGPAFTPMMGSLALGATTPAEKAPGGRPHPETMDSGDRQRFLSTKLSPPSKAEGLEPSAGEPAASTPKSRKSVIVLLATAALAGAAVYLGWAGQPSLTGHRNEIPAPPAATNVEPVKPAVVPEGRATASALPSTVPAPTPAPAASSPEAALAEAPKKSAARTRPARLLKRRKQATEAAAAPKTDQFGIGIPTE